MAFPINVAIQLVEHTCFPTFSEIVQFLRILNYALLFIGRSFCPFTVRRIGPSINYEKKLIYGSLLSQKDEERLVSVPRTCNKRNFRDVIVLTLYFMTWDKNCGHLWANLAKNCGLQYCFEHEIDFISEQN